MSGGQAYIEDVLHKAVVEVNEEGTVAAAATAVVMTRSLPPPPIDFTIDRPFLFVVYDQLAKAVLFAAKVESV
jgi:serpin B